MLDFIQKRGREASSGHTSSQARVAISPSGELNASSFAGHDAVVRTHLFGAMIVMVVVNKIALGWRL